MKAVFLFLLILLMGCEPKGVSSITPAEQFESGPVGVTHLIGGSPGLHGYDTMSHLDFAKYAHNKDSLTNEDSIELDKRIKELEEMINDCDRPPTPYEYDSVRMGDDYKGLE